jgi:hypothetical protein
VTRQKYKHLDFSSFQLLKRHLEIVKQLDISIIGQSMAPLYRPEGQLVKVSYIEDLNSLKRFDVIVFWQNDILVSHYFWKKNSYFTDPNDPTLVTRPLNPIKSFDHPIKYNQILGILPEKINFWLKIKILYKIIF